ncbi:MAG: pentapeptide repeat-containing protein, partial [Thermoplasmata archaeon]|nr:pentapeptide repeat-containing protein [Thermoplasmata archaeon]
MGNEEEGQAEAQPETEPKAVAQPEAKPKTCSYEREDGNRCGGTALEGSKEGCIFHAASKDVTECLRAFNRQLDEGSHDFEGYQLPEADLSGRVFHGDVSFRNARFTGDVTFKKATFPEQTDLRGTVFEGNVTFEGAVFGGDAKVAGATFKSDALWNGVTFGNEALFEGCALGPLTDFDHAVFRGDAHFERARIAGRLNMDYSEFEKFSFFMDLECDGEGDFSFVEFMAYADFARSRWKELNMTDVIFEKRGCFDGAVIKAGTFEDAELRHVTFRDVDLSNVFTTGASLEEAYMAEARWGQLERGPLGKKVVVKEETIAEEEGTRDSIKRAEAAHRNLKESYKNEGDYAMAGKFFIREMDLHT